jgi:hypothetical protein
MRLLVVNSVSATTSIALDTIGCSVVDTGRYSLESYSSTYFCDCDTYISILLVHLRTVPMWAGLYWSRLWMPTFPGNVYRSEWKGVRRSRRMYLWKMPLFHWWRRLSLFRTLLWYLPGISLHFSTIGLIFDFVDLSDKVCWIQTVCDVPAMANRSIQWIEMCRMSVYRDSRKGIACLECFWLGNLERMPVRWSGQ